MVVLLSLFMQQLGEAVLPACTVAASPRTQHVGNSQRLTALRRDMATSTSSAICNCHCNAHTYLQYAAWIRKGTATRNMVGLSTKKERKLQKKIEEFDKAYTEYNRAAIEAAREGNTGLQLQCLQIALAYDASYERAKRKLAKLQDGTAAFPKQQLSGVIQASDKTSSGKVHGLVVSPEQQISGAVQASGNTSSMQVHDEECSRMDANTGHSTPGGATDASELVGVAVSGTKVLLPAASSDASGSCGYRVGSASAGCLRRRVPRAVGGMPAHHQRGTQGLDAGVWSDTWQLTRSFKAWRWCLRVGSAIGAVAMLWLLRSCGGPSGEQAVWGGIRNTLVVVTQAPALFLAALWSRDIVLLGSFAMALYWCVSRATRYWKIEKREQRVFLGKYLFRWSEWAKDTLEDIGWRDKLLNWNGALYHSFK